MKRFIGFAAALVLVGSVVAISQTQLWSPPLPNRTFIAGADNDALLRPIIGIDANGAVEVDPDAIGSSFGGALTVDGALTQTGAATFASTVAVTGAATFSTDINGVTNIVMEGATADASEATISVEDVTADVTYTFRDDSADIYFVTGVRDGVLTEGNFFLPGAAFPTTEAAAEDALANDLEVVCYRAFLPYPLTVTEAVVYEFQVTTAGASDFIGVAIYEDADAGTQLTEGATVYAADGASLVIDLADVTLDPDFYRFCASQNDVSAQDWLGYAQSTGEAAVMNETASEINFGLAANAATGDANMPATTGALSSSTESLPLIKFQTN